MSKPARSVGPATDLHASCSSERERRVPLQIQQRTPDLHLTCSPIKPNNAQKKPCTGLAAPLKTTSPNLRPFGAMTQQRAEPCPLECLHKLLRGHISTLVEHTFLEVRLFRVSVAYGTRRLRALSANDSVNACHIHMLACA